MNSPTISKIRIYPVKSLDPIEVDEAEIGIKSLKYDRAYAMLGADGRFVNGKRTGRVNQLEAKYDLENLLINLRERETKQWNQFELREGNQDLNKYLSLFFGIETVLLHRTKGELMDIPAESSVTVVSEASLKSLQNDIALADLENLRLRFRTNIEIGGVEPYWEENLFHSSGIGMQFNIGNVKMVGVSPRARCNVPPKDPFTGEMDKSFVKKMIISRDNNLPVGSILPEFGHSYHLTVNTFIPDTEQGKMIRIGDTLEVLDPVKLGD